MAMKLIRESKKTEYKVEDGKTLVVMQPEYMAKDITVKVIEMPPMGSDSGD